MTPHVPQGPTPPAVSGPHLWAGSFAIESGLLHVIAGQDHFQEWWGYGGRCTATRRNSASSSRT